ncbi:MBL fold metallo-hydrolase [Candidatus Micrarchaeota archaeon]|nr:MBL fold metallo-hydrolase [Candidatus Micrarchaeota archaeon]
MKFTVLGSGDTRGLPKVGCHCATCADALKTGFERKRFGIVVEHESDGKTTRILIDASPDLRRAFLQYGFSSKDLDAVLLTHEHYDHVAGLGDFFYEGKTIPLYARPDCIDHVFSEHAYGYLRGFRLFDFHKMDWLAPFSVGGADGIRVTPVPVTHSIETAGFVFEAGGKKAAVLTDCRADVPAPTQDAIRDADLLFTDGWMENSEQFKEAHRAFHSDLSESALTELSKRKKRNHLLISEALELAMRVGAKKTVLLHVAHAASPHAALSRRYDSAKIQVGFDGSRFEA